MQEYLDVSNRKPRGMFRDIVIESEYDPMAAHGNAVTYDARVRHDPCKLELRKHASKPRKANEPPPVPRPEFLKPNQGGPEPRMSVILWDKLDATPYGRLGKLVPRMDAKPYALANRVVTDQYDTPIGNDVLQRELPLGKRCFTQRTSIQGILEQ